MHDFSCRSSLAKVRESKKLNGTATTNRQVEAAVAAGSDRGHHVRRIHALDDGAGFAVAHGTLCSSRSVSPTMRQGYTLKRSESVPSQPVSLRRPIAARNAGRSWPDGTPRRYIAVDTRAARHLLASFKLDGLWKRHAATLLHSCMSVKRHSALGSAIIPGD